LAFAGREPARTPRLSFDERFLQGEGFEIDRRSVFEERFAFDQSAVFEERFAFDQRPEPFEARFALAATTTTEPEEATTSGAGTVASVVRMPSPQNPAAGRSGAKGFSLASASSVAVPEGSGKSESSSKKVRMAALEMPKGTGTGVTLDPESKTAIYDITAR